MEYKIILASTSPRRRELIKYIGLPYECVSVDADESFDALKPGNAVKQISAKKAAAYTSVHIPSDCEIIIGADTAVTIDGLILGKPKDRDDAFRTLKMLSGRTHRVITGVTLIYTENGKMRTKTFCESTSVTFACLSDEEINCYLDIGEYKDKAGSYAIQGIFSRHIKAVSGDYNNVVGLPVSRLYSEISNIIKK